MDKRQKIKYLEVEEVQSKRSKSQTRESQNSEVTMPKVKKEKVEVIKSQMTEELRCKQVITGYVKCTYQHVRVGWFMLRWVGMNQVRIG